MSKLTKEEWTARYVLQFGRAQLWQSGHVAGEHDFVEEMRKDLNCEYEHTNVYAIMSQVLRDYDHATRPRSSQSS
jgi:hypothetical protein